jgi:hypothetical protein
MGDPQKDIHKAEQKTVERICKDIHMFQELYGNKHDKTCKLGHQKEFQHIQGEVFI